MKASELRIGNIVARINRSGIVHLPVYSNPFKIFSLNPFDGKIYRYDKNPALLPDSDMQEFDINDICGIPLTEEWLVRFGLKPERLIEFDANIGKWYTMDGSRFLFQYDGNGRIHNGVLGIEIKHVHQLQNLYFALTGDELTIK